MSNLSDIRQELSSIEHLEKELNLKQLQVNRLLSITQAINHNVSAEDLFAMYTSFLHQEMELSKLALYVYKRKKWQCASAVGIAAHLLELDISKHLEKYRQLDNLRGTEHPLLEQFDIVIPVLHKDQPIAYVFIGGFREDEDMFNKVQFITTLTNIVAVAIENKRLFKKQIEQERLRREMELASEMQRMLIPKTLPAKECYELASIYKPHLGVGGDYFDFVEFGDSKIAFCVGDISGKGLAAALLMANFQAMFHTLINKRHPLDEFVEELNTALFTITQGERFITFFVGEYDIQARTLRYVNAGHNPPIIVRDGKAHLLDKGCTILGSFQELPAIEIGALNIESEALVLTYTDGLTDIQNKDEEYLSENLLQDFVAKNYRLSAAAFNEVLWKFTQSFIGEGNYPDDFTILTCKLFTPPNPC